MAETRVVSIDEAAALVRSGDLVGIGGIQGNHPSAVIRAIARAGTDRLRVVSGPSGMPADLLVATGQISWLAAPHWGVDSLVPVGPALRARAAADDIELWECDEGIMLAALRAAGERLPYLPWHGGVGTDLPLVNPDLTEYVDEPSGRTLLRVPALDLDVALLRALEADEYGNVRYFRHSNFADLTFARAARTVVVEVERLVPHETFQRDPERTVLHRVDAVTVAPSGSHPFRAPGVMLQDEAWLREWATELRAATENGTPWTATEVVRRELEPASHQEYLDRVGRDRLEDLRQR